MSSASATHMITARGLFNPESALAHFELISIHELLESSLSLVRIYWDAVLFTSLVLVKNWSTVQTISLSTLHAIVFRIITFMKLKHHCAIWCGAAWKIFIIFHSLIKSKLEVLFTAVIRNQIKNITYVNSFFAWDIRAFQGKFSLFNLNF